VLKVKMTTQTPESIETQALVTWVFQVPAGAWGIPDAGVDLERLSGESPALPPVEPRLESGLEPLNHRSGGRLAELARAGELTGKAGEAVLLHQPPGFKAKRLLLVGAGKPEKFSLSEIRNLTGAAARYLKARSVSEFTFWFRPLQAGMTTAEAAEAAVEGVALANFDPDRYQTEKKNRKPIESLQLAGLVGEAEKGIQRGQVIAEAQNFTRELVNEPGNRLTPRMFAERATEAARQAGLEVDILDENRMRELKMGALLSVAQGSAEPPRMVVLTYTPPGWSETGSKPGKPILGLVGKGITFDSGGISIKPGEGMEKMKYDMAGGAAVVGALRAIAELKPAVKVIGVVPLSENLPGGRAQKPGDVQFAMTGKSIEVINTDAEGRLVLADALAYARQLGATHLIDAATLTGAIVIALGNVHAGAFTNNQAFLDAFLASARVVGEKFWPMPLDDDYHDNITSEIADIRNTGKGRGGGAINGAMFLKEFAGETPWIHLDIAGTAWLEEGKAWMAKGPTGICVRSFVRFAEEFRG
jgi:leucyl aminopeptidase